MKQNVLLAVGIVAICGTVIYSSHLFKQTGITIENAGSTSASIQNSISVSGQGKVASAPDLMRISAGVSELAPTTRAAQKQANQKLNRVLEILKENGVSDKYVQTQNLSFQTEYDWRDSGRKILGQRVRQTLSVEIPGIDKKPARVTDILDALGGINGLEVHSVSFDIEDKEALYSSAREEAYEKAHQKAKELAKLGKVKLGKPITISTDSVHVSPIYQRNFAKMEMDAVGGGGSAVPAGELDVTASVSVVFEIE